MQYKEERESDFKYVVSTGDIGKISTDKIFMD